MSTSYGPGRYDPDYEEKGRDYPIGYVRWTENRNMQSFVDLLGTGRLDISGLITHTFDLDQAPDAYDMILSRKEAFSGILIKYAEQADLKRSIMLKKSVIRSRKSMWGLWEQGLLRRGHFCPT